jgi:hypothetical protein
MAFRAGAMNRERGEQVQCIASILKSNASAINHFFTSCFFRELKCQDSIHPVTHVAGHALLGDFG